MTRSIIRSVAGIGPALLDLMARPGLAAARWPAATLLALAALLVAMAFGLPRLKFDDTLHGLFRSVSEDYVNYERLQDRFATSEHDVVLAIEGVKLANREHIEQLQELFIRLQLVEGVASVTSIFSMRDAPDSHGVLRPLFLDELPTGEAYLRLVERLDRHPIVSGRLLSPPDPDGRRLLIMIAGLDFRQTDAKGNEPVIRRIRETVRGIELPAGVTIGLTGVPLIKMEIVNSTQLDVLVFSVLGTIVSTIVCLMFFPRLRMFLVVALPAPICVVMAVGLFGWLSGRIDPLSTAILPLLLVIATSDAIHLVSAMRRELAEGAARREAIAEAVREVGRACALTSLTTAVAFSAICLSESQLLRTFGAVGAAATLLAYLVMIVMVPALAAVLLPKVAPTPGARARGQDWLPAILSRASTALFDLLRRAPAAIALASLALMIAMAALYLRLEPAFRMSDLIAPRHESTLVAKRIEKALSATQPLNVMIELPAGMDLLGPAARSIVERAHAVVAAQGRIERVTSMATVYEWLASIGITAPEDQRQHLARLPADALARFVNLKQRTLLVEGAIRDLEAFEVSALVARLNAALAPLRAEQAAVRFAVTGLPALSASRSAALIRQLSGGLLASVIIVTVMMGIGFGSLRVAALSVPPNVLGQITVGASLYLLGRGIDYPTAVALIVAFGLSIDNTIHMLNRSERAMAAGVAPVPAVRETMSSIGPVVITAAVILCAGMAVTMVSELPPTYGFGIACLITLLIGVVGDMVLLPCLLLLAPALRQRVVAARVPRQPSG